MLARLEPGTDSSHWPVVNGDTAPAGSSPGRVLKGSRYDSAGRGPITGIDATRLRPALISSSRMAWLMPG